METCSLEATSSLRVGSEAMTREAKIMNSQHFYAEKKLAIPIFCALLFKFDPLTFF